MQKENIEENLSLTTNPYYYTIITMTTKTQLLKEIQENLPILSPPELIRIFEMIFGQGEEDLDSVDWKN
jgi:hypothetical protein